MLFTGHTDLQPEHCYVHLYVSLCVCILVLEGRADVDLSLIPTGFVQSLESLENAHCYVFNVMNNEYE